MDNPNAGLLKIRLVVAGTANQDDALVQDVHILPFVRLPEIVQWGERFFVLTDRLDGATGMPIYAEGLCVIANETLRGIPPKGADHD